MQDASICFVQCSSHSHRGAGVSTHYLPTALDSSCLKCTMKVYVRDTYREVHSKYIILRVSPILVYGMGTARYYSAGRLSRFLNDAEKSILITWQSLHSSCYKLHNTYMHAMQVWSMLYYDRRLKDNAVTLCVPLLIAAPVAPSWFSGGP